ncbi:MAG: hypothetical protein Q9226_000180 [Calogaya cf. arnoldii]
MSRLALSDADKEARDWFVQTSKSLGCEVTVDKMGNVFAVRPGRRRGFPPTCAGSHLDTQPTGGRYDGILGVCAGLEMLKVLHEHKIETHFPVGVVNWTNEEGARFPISMVASGVWAGEIPLEKAHSLVEVGSDGRTMKQELERIGYLGETDAHHQAMPLAAHFELHIEQGPRLQAANKRIGIVHGVQAYRVCGTLRLPTQMTPSIGDLALKGLRETSYFTVDVLGSGVDMTRTSNVNRGRENHTGTTDFGNRSDALLAAAKLILHSHRLAVRYDALASTGIIQASPGSTNTVPGRVQFSLDIRAATDDVLLDLERNLQSDFDEIIKGNPVYGLNDGLEVIGRPCTIKWALDAPSQATRFDEKCIDCVRQSAADLLGPKCKDLVQEMISGAEIPSNG